MTTHRNPGTLEDRVYANTLVRAVNTLATGIHRDWYEMEDHPFGNSKRIAELAKAIADGRRAQKASGGPINKQSAEWLKNAAATLKLAREHFGSKPNPATPSSAARALTVHSISQAITIRKELAAAIAWGCPPHEIASLRRAVKQAVANVEGAQMNEHATPAKRNPARPSGGYTGYTKAETLAILRRMVKAGEHHAAADFSLEAIAKGAPEYVVYAILRGGR